MKPPAKAGVPRAKDETRRELVGRLQQLRRVTKQTSEMYLAAIQSELAALGERAAGTAEGEAALPRSAMKRMIVVLDEALSKEPKASLKSLRRIEAALDELTRLAGKEGGKG